MRKKHRVRKVLLIILAVIVVIVLAAIIFLKCWPAFGGRASAEDKENYASRATNYQDGKFQNEGTFSIMHETDQADDNIMSNKGTAPEEALPAKMPTYGEAVSQGAIQVTWFGHSTMLLQMHDLNILVDPVFSDRSSPVSFAGNKRFSYPPIDVDELPEIDVVILSHDHYDHLDYKVIQSIDSKVAHYIVPLGVENHLIRWDVAENKIENMAWWEETEYKGLTIGCTPARHYSGRSLDDQFATLWASWVFKDEFHQVYESGDSGYGDHFQKIHDKYGDFDFVLMDCAQYDMDWPEVHMFPEESIKAVETLGAPVAMPVHWGAFTLARHAWDDPVERFVKAGEAAGKQIVTPQIGETMVLSRASEYMNRWWKNIK